MIRHRAAILAAGACLAAASLTCAQYPSQNVTLLSRLSLSQIGGGSGNDIWGWVDPLTQREYAIMGRSNGTAFVDITDGSNPIYLGNLPSHTGSSTWRDIKVYEDHAFIVSDNNGPHGMQVFDLTQLRGISTPQTFANTAHFNGFRNAHNIAINEESGHAYIIGSNQAAGGLYMIDIRNPLQPTYAGQFSADGYTHDTQVVNYRGPDPNYAGREIAFNSNEDTLTIVDVTNKSSSTMVARKTYPQSYYTHQGWLSEDQRYFFVDDELDEYYQGVNTRTHIFDVSSLNNPVYIGAYSSPLTVIDHNLYVKDGYIFQANYEGGLRILEITDPANGLLTEAGYLDTYPTRNGLAFNGAWSVYPFFEHGKLVVSDINNGLFVAQFDLLATVSGDFNADGVYDCADIDALIGQIAGGTNNRDFDLTGDGRVDLADRDAWLDEAGAANLGEGHGYIVADGNLDGTVDVSDFNVWSATKFTSQAAWCAGDFSADGLVDIEDFNLWNSHRFQSSLGLNAVPEPCLALELAAGLLLGAARYTRRRK